ncbi:MAG: amidohydrolase family protein [Parvularculaceae bacterium]|nr:amidohydrolase family protein [Parvularculaceae bacterium]
MRLTIMKTLATSLVALAASVSVASAQTIAIQNARVYTMAGADAGRLDNGDVIIRDGVIAAIGQDLPAPEGATVINAQGRIVTPGLIAPWSQIGLVEIGLDEEANDASTKNDFPVSAGLDAVDAFNPASTLIAINRAGGVTRAVSSPSFGAKMFGGQGAIVDLSGRANSITRAQAVQSVAMGAAGIGYNGGTRLGNWAALREALDDAKAYAANPGGFVMRPRNGGLSIADLKALGAVAQGRQPLVVALDSATDIRALMKLKAQYAINVIILGGSQAHLVAEEIAAANIPVLLDPIFNLPSQFEDLTSTLANAARLQAAGVTIAFASSYAGTYNLRLLPQTAGNAVANGLPYDAALAALTINPARIFGVADRLGSLEIGKTADVVIWDGDPLEVSTRPVAVLIDGRVTSLKNRQTMLRDRYKDLSKGDLPLAYRGAQ